MKPGQLPRLRAVEPPPASRNGPPRHQPAPWTSQPQRRRIDWGTVGLLLSIVWLFALLALGLWKLAELLGA